MYSVDITYSSGSKINQKYNTFSEVNSYLASINEKIMVEIHHDLYFSRQFRENGQPHRLDGPAVFTTHSSLFAFPRPIIKELTSIYYYLHGTQYINPSAWLEDVRVIEFKNQFKDMVGE